MSLQPDFARLLRALRAPAEMATFTPHEWEGVVRLARSADLLARLAVLARRAGVLDAIDPAPARHLLSAELLCARQHAELRMEVQEVALALRGLQSPVVLLKGAAYVMAGLQAGLGRMVSDVDILVPQQLLSQTEADLMMAGWMGAAGSAYDDRYYRRWMHELPPMRHIHRNTVLDVHHAILPTTARLRPDAERMMQRAQALPDLPGLWVLAPVDRVLHSATHLMHEGEFDVGLRGLVDLDALLQEASASQAGFWPALVQAAQEQDLAPPLSHALRCLQRVLGTPVPEAVSQALASTPAVLRSARWQPLRDRLFDRVLLPDHPLLNDRWTPLARQLMYLRGHWLRMPPAMLAWHLFRKATMRPPPAQPSGEGRTEA